MTAEKSRFIKAKVVLVSTYYFFLKKTRNNKMQREKSFHFTQKKNIFSKIIFVVLFWK